MEFLTAVFGDLWHWVTIFLGINAAVWFFLKDLHKQSRRDKWIDDLRQDRFVFRYRAILDAALNRIDRWLSPGWPDDTTTKRNPKTEPARAWSHGLLNLNLLLAVAYPILGLLIYWAITGNPGRIGSAEVIPAQPIPWKRWLPFLLWGLAIVFVMLAHYAESNLKKRTFLLVFLSFAFAGAFAVAFTVAGAVAFAGAFAGAVAVAFTVAFAGAVAFTVAFAFAGLQDYIGGKFNRRGLALLLYSAIMFLLLCGFTLWYAPSDLNDDDKSVILFLGFLPLLNAWADFVSFGLTRWALRHGVASNRIWLGAILDALAALGIFILLVFSIILTIHFIRPGGGTPLISLAELFADLGNPATRSEYGWLAFMLFSTLLPTFAHLCIGSLALLTPISKPLGRWVARLLRQGDNPGGKLGSYVLSFTIAVAIWLPLFLIWHLLTFIGPFLLETVLDLCQWFHGQLVHPTT